MKRFENFVTDMLIYSVFKPFRIFVLTIIGICLMKIYEVITAENIILLMTAMIVLWNAREIYIKNELDLLNEKLKDVLKKEGTFEYYLKGKFAEKWRLREKINYLEKLR